MNCPYCDKEMKHGYIKTEGASGLFFMPDDQDYGLIPSVKGIEKKGGVVLDGPYLTRIHVNSVAAFQCEECRKIIISY